MSKPMEKVWFLLCYIFQGSSYLSPYAYGAMHRMHHAYTDTDKDPHSPEFSGNVFKMMWDTKKVYSDIYRGRMTLDEKFTKNLPAWHSFDRFAESWGSRLAWCAVYIAIYVAFAPYWWMYLFLPIHFLMGPIHGAIVNYFAHKVGYSSFKQKNTSRNLIFMNIFMQGEGYHNNHHKFPSRPNFAIKWFEFDTVYPVILLLNAVGVIKLARVRA
jgi:stearoyl-CoA desaturase (delta-9 desaturase)